MPGADISRAFRAEGGTFLLRLSDALRVESSAEAIANRALQMLSKQIRLNRCYIGIYKLAEDVGDFPHQVHDDDLPPLPAQVRLSDFPKALQIAFDRTLVVDDVTEMEGLSDSDRAGFKGLGLGALIAATLHKGENNPLWAVVAASTCPRNWTKDEVALVEEVAERTWAAVERARSDAALHESETRFRLMIDAVPQIVWITDRHGRMEFLNRQFAEFTGADAEAWTAAEMAAKFMHPDDGAAVVASFNAALRTGRSFEIEHRIRSAQGDYRWFLARAEPYCEPGRSAIVRWFGSSVDIHDRKIAEEALRALNADLERKVTERALARGRTWQVSPDIMGVLNIEGRFEQSNPAWASVLGWSEEEVAKTLFFDFIHPDDMAKTEAAWDAAIARGEPALRFENRYRTKDGGWRWLSWVAVPDDGKVYCTARDVTAEKAQEAALAERTSERDRMWLTSPNLLLVVGYDGVFRRVNPAWTTILGYDEHDLVGTRVDRLVHPDDLELTEEALIQAAGGPLPVVENRYRHKDGSYRWISWITGPPDNGIIYATGRHITAEKERQAELEQAQAALLQSQKMEAMGQLTGGVAHDFNNLLTPILGSLDMLHRRGLGNEREQRLISGGLESAERAKTLVQRLLAFARRQPLQTKSVDLGPLVRGMAELVRSTAGPQVKVVVDAAATLPPAKADPNQLEMAILNLAVNARDAMPEGGKLRITTDEETVDRQHRANLTPGRYLRLSVADTGSGMDEATLSRAVEPFYSTKGVGKGTGLGLSMVHGLASQLGGALTISSTPGSGTNVELWLPQSAEPHVCAEIEARAPPVANGNGTALLVDDEDLVRLSTADMLTELGYSVVEAASAEEALKLVDRGLEPVVIVTDHLMPGMSGTDLARLLLDRRPETKVLVVSGYAEAEGITPDLPRLTKPFRSEDLSRSLAALG